MTSATARASVCAVVGDASERLEQALSDQRRQPDTVVRDREPLRTGLRRGLGTGCEWIWLLDASAAPRPQALRAMLEALDRLKGLPQPVVLAGLVLTEDGLVDEPRAAWYRTLPSETAMVAAERRLLPIRAAASPVLVHCREAAAERLPRQRLAPLGAVLEWTARLLRAHAGYWVPQSENVALIAARDPLRDPLTATALLIGGGMAGRDRLRVVYKLLSGRP